MIEARVRGATVARLVASRPCRAEIDGNELLVGIEPLVAQVGNVRWSGDTDQTGTTLRKDGVALHRMRATADRGLEVLDPVGAVLLHITADGALSNAHGEVLRRTQPARDPAGPALQIGDSVVTGTSDLALGVLVTAPELIPEVRALAACHRLFHREPTARK